MNQLNESSYKKLSITCIDELQIDPMDIIDNPSQLCQIETGLIDVFLKNSERIFTHQCLSDNESNQKMSEREEREYNDFKVSPIDEKIAKIHDLISFKGRLDLSITSKLLRIMHKYSGIIIFTQKKE